MRSFQKGSVIYYVRPVLAPARVRGELAKPRKKSTRRT